MPLEFRGQMAKNESVSTARTRDALALAELAYDMFKEEQRETDIIEGNHE